MPGAREGEHASLRILVGVWVGVGVGVFVGVEDERTPSKLNLTSQYPDENTSPIRGRVISPK